MSETYPLPAVVVLARWDYKNACPVVYPSRLVNNEHIALLSQGDVDAEITKFENLNETRNAGEQRESIHVFPATEAQAGIDALAERMVEIHRESVEALGVGRLRIYGFTPEQLAQMGYEQEEQPL